MSGPAAGLAPVLLLQEGGSAFPGTMEIVFLSLWALFSLLYWGSYRKSESLPGSAAKVLGLLLVAAAASPVLSPFIYTLF